uniref:Uncharacterized protein n=1 Tax=Arundo donax TaxID=35708 RepID=A0A0A9FDH9_ARUDO
MNILQILNL